jgi:sec-independent protein translocase protein TatC
MAKQHTANNAKEEKEQGFIAHLLELRDRLLRMVLVIAIVFIILFPFAQDLYNWLSDPLVSQLPEGQRLIAIGVASPFLIPYKLALLAAFLIALPVVFYQLWAFIAPALYKHEKRLVIPLLASSVALFYIGMAFAFYVVLPLMFSILPSFAPTNVDVTPDIAQYLDFVMMIFVAFGFGFEMPIATILLVSTGIVTAKELGKKRPYVIVGAFIVGMFLTPPDVLSQLLLAIPMWLLFELGLVLSRLFKQQIKVAGEEKEAMDDAEYHLSAPAAATSAGVAAATTSDAASSSTETLFEDDRYIMQELDEDGNPIDDHAADHDHDDKDSDKDKDDDSETYRPMTDDEMDAELDRMDEEEEEQERLLAQKEADAKKDKSSDS